MSLQSKFGAVLFAKDVARVATFYRELLSMAVVVEQGDLVVLEAASFQLVVHGIPKQIARSIAIRSPPERRTEVPTKLILPVISIAELRARAAALGGELNRPEQEFEARGFRACDGHDPEGNVVQFRQAIG